MKTANFTLILPGDHWGDLPRGIDSAAAANLLACWTALWHPQLLVDTRQIPKIKGLQRVRDLAGEPGGRLLAPQVVAASDLAEGDEESGEVATTATRPGALHLTRGETRAEIWAQLAGELERPLEPQVGGVAELAALGFAYQQVEMLTRAMHYDGLLRHELFETAAIEAAEAGLAGDSERLASRLDDAYDLLMQARNHYYPVDFYLIDVGLLAGSIAGPQFEAACRRAKGTNVLLTGAVLREFAQHAPQSLAALREAIAEGRVGVCGGSQTETPLAAMTPEALLADLREGLATCEELLEVRPAVFAHRGGPIAPVVPGVLYRLGYIGVIQANFAGQRSPSTLHNRTAWCGPDGVHIEAVNALPIDVGSAKSLLELAITISRSMDYELAATILLAGWPGHRTEAYDDLCEVARRSSVLGRMVRLEDYFEQTTSYDHAGPLEFDEYPGPPLGTLWGEEEGASPRLAQLARLAGCEGEGQEAGEALAELVGATPTATSSAGVLLLNGSSFPRRAAGFGWQWVSPSGDFPLKGDATQLINGAMEVHLHPETGGISAVRLHNRRGNILSQRLVLLPPLGKGYAVHDDYQIALDRIEPGPTSDDRVSATSHARVVDREGRVMAHLRQTTSLDRYFPRIEVAISGELEQEVGSGKEVWLVANQLAFREEVDLRRGVQGMALPTGRNRFVAHWFQFASESNPLTVVADQARRHFRHHEQRVDTWLIDQTQATFAARLSFWLETRYPARAAWEESHPGELLKLPTTRPKQPAGWWLNLGAANVVATHFGMEQVGDVPIVRLRILETEGRLAEVRLASWRPFAEAQQVDFRGQAERLLSVKEGVVQLSMAPYEWVELVAAWQE